MVRGEGRVANATSEDRITSACNSTLAFLACTKIITYLTLLFHKFISNSERHKIKRTTLCKSLEEGGFNITEVNVFMDSLKVT